jgi:predicted DNA-binding transcriptional regulator AlpA
MTELLSRKHLPTPKKKRHHLDRRAPAIAAAMQSRDSDQLLSTKQLAALLAVSVQLLENWRQNGEGPEWIALGPRCIRYKRSDVLAWLNTRASKNLEVA